MYLLLLLTTVALAGSNPDSLAKDHEPAVDNGQCIPIMCEHGVPPVKCTRLCALRRYVPICQPKGNFCLCQRLVNNRVELVSPDEVEDQPPTEQTHTYSVFAIFLPIKNFFYAESIREDDRTQPSAQPLAYEAVNVHEGRLFWDFRYILSGLFLLMVCLVAYELVMCRVQTYATRADAADIKKQKIMAL